MNFSKLIWALAITFTLPLSGQAQTAMTEFGNNLYDTGLGNATSGNNATTLAGGSNDTHYILTSLPAGAGVTAGADAVTVHQGNLPGTWVANSTATLPARWDSSSGTAANQPAGTYDFVLTLSNIPVNSVVTISGNIAAANKVNILANGTQEFALTTNATYSTAFNAFSFTFNSSSVSTSDTLSFNIINTLSTTPTGLQVQGLTGSFVPVPEPRDTALLMLLFVGAIVAVRKMRARNLRV